MPRAPTPPQGARGCIQGVLRRKYPSENGPDGTKGSLLPHPWLFPRVTVESFDRNKSQEVEPCCRHRPRAGIGAPLGSKSEAIHHTLPSLTLPRFNLQWGTAVESRQVRKYSTFTRGQIWGTLSSPLFCCFILLLRHISEANSVHFIPLPLSDIFNYYSYFCRLKLTIQKYNP